MSPLKNLLFLADQPTPSAHALRRAMHLANRHHARLTVLGVLAPGDANGAGHSAGLGAGHGGSEPGAQQNRRLIALLDAVDAARDTLRETTATAHPPRLDIRTRIEIGHPAAIALRALRKGRHDLLIKAATPTRALPGGGGWRASVAALFGDLDTELLRHAPCPVWIEPVRDRDQRPAHSGPEGPRRIIAAIDPPVATIGDPGVNRQATVSAVLTVATRLARASAAELDVVHAWRLPGEAAMARGRSGVSATELEMLRAHAECDHRAALHDALAPYRDPTLTLREALAHGTPEAVIRRLADTGHADLIVIGSEGRCGLPALLIGNTVERLLDDLPGALLTVKAAHCARLPQAA